MATELPEDDSISTPSTERALGRLEGQLAALSASMVDFQAETRATWGRVSRIAEANHAVVQAHINSDARAFATITADLAYMRSILEKIRKPVETFIASRNVVVGLISILAALGAAIGYFTGTWHWIYGWFASKS